MKKLKKYRFKRLKPGDVVRLIDGRAIDVTKRLSFGLYHGTCSDFNKSNPDPIQFSPDNVFEVLSRFTPSCPNNVDKKLILKKLKQLKTALTGWIKADKWPDQLAAESKGYFDDGVSYKEMLYDILNNLPE